jgi:predicted deacylase
MLTDRGGLLTVHPKVTNLVKKGEVVATQSNVFGDLIRTYTAPEDGVVIGHSVNPVGQTGSRILHLGVLMNEEERRNVNQISDEILVEHQGSV